MNLQEYKDVFVFVEMLDGKVSDVSLELLGKARELVAARGEGAVSALLLTDGASDPYAVLTKAGADRILEVKDPRFGMYHTESFTYALNEVVSSYKPETVLFGATAIGRDLAPRLSARLGTGLTADCTSLDVDAESGNLLMTRPAFGGNIMATITCENHRPQMATVRPGVMQKAEPMMGEPNVVTVAVEIPQNCDRVEILETVIKKQTKKDIREAKILVSGGRGMGAPENFDLLEEVAEVLGGAVSSSRAAVDAGWMPKSVQVGQTGQTVRPDVYFACGISGAIQHVAGMEDSGLIIAINKDESAPIFGVADLGIVGNVHNVLPALKKELEEIL